MANINKLDNKMHCLQTTLLKRSVLEHLKETAHIRRKSITKSVERHEITVNLHNAQRNAVENARGWRLGLGGAHNYAN